MLFPGVNLTRRRQCTVPLAVSITALLCRKWMATKIPSVRRTPTLFWRQKPTWGKPWWAEAGTYQDRVEDLGDGDEAIHPLGYPGSLGAGAALQASARTW